MVFIITRGMKEEALLQKDLSSHYKKKWELSTVKIYITS